MFAVAWVVLTVGTDVALRRRLRPTTRSLAGPSAAIMLTVLANLYAILAPHAPVPTIRDTCRRA